MMFVVMLLVSFGLSGCSVEPGGSEDPKDFRTQLTPAGGAAPAAEVSAPALVRGEDTGRLDELEKNLGYALDRIGRLEIALSSLEESLSSIETTAAQALEKAKEGPLAGVDVSNEDEMGKALMQQSLEQIIGISRLLLDKMEDKLAAQPSGEQPATPNPAPAEPGTQVQ